MPVVESIIRFVGLCLFTQTAPDPVHVLLPHIDPPSLTEDVIARRSNIYWMYPLPVPASKGGAPPAAPRLPAPRAKADKPTSGAATPGSTKLRGVEAHIAGIAFPAWSYDEANSTWKAKRLPNTDLLYVPLDGERVQFITTATNEAASIDELDVPKLQTCCPDMPPPSHQSAQAVIEIPQGALTACSGVTGRIDTEWRLKHRSLLTIHGTKGAVAKEVRLENAPTIVVFNIPPRLLDGDHSARPRSDPDGEPHHHAYYAMSGATCTASLCIGARARPPCGSSGIIAIDSPTKSKAANDFQCSNSQWP